MKEKPMYKPSMDFDDMMEQMQKYQKIMDASIQPLYDKRDVEMTYTREK